MLISQLIKQGLNILLLNNIENPHLEACILLGHVLQMTRSEIILKGEVPVSENEKLQFLRLIDRKKNGEPTAYITGLKEFYGRDFIVNPSVLIPRPETEELAEWICKGHRGPSKLLDLCCGSGCLGITLCLEMDITEIYFSDISEGALKTTGENIKRHIAAKKNHVLKSNLFENISENEFNLIASNPPYVVPDEYENLAGSVLNFEPKEALLVENPGSFNIQLVSGAFSKLSKNGWLYLESSPYLISSLKEIFSRAGFQEVETKRDLSGKERFIRGLKI